MTWYQMQWIINDLVQHCSNSSALTMELLQSYTKQSNYVIDKIDYLDQWWLFLYCIYAPTGQAQQNY